MSAQTLRYSTGDIESANQTLALLDNLKVLKNSRSKIETEAAIRQLLDIDFEVSFITADVGEDLLRNCVLHCADGDAVLSDLTKQMIWTLLNSAENQVHLSTPCLGQLISFCLKDICSLPIPRMILSFHALGSLVYQNSHRLNSLWPKLSEVIQSCLLNKEDDEFLRYSALKVLQALTIRRDKTCDYLSSDQVDAVSLMIIEGVMKKTSFSSEIMYCKLRVAMMKTILNLANADASLQTERMSYILGYLRHLTFYGFPGYTARPLKEFGLFPSPVCNQLPQIGIEDLEAARDKPVMRRSHGKKQSSRTQRQDNICQLGNSDNVYSENMAQRRRLAPWITSDSSEAETSDSDAVHDPLTRKKKIKNLKSKVRQLAYDTIRMLLLTINKKERFGYLLNFFPQQSGTVARKTEHTLVLSMLRDPEARVRTSSINVLKDFLANSKQYITLACESSHATSFTSVSEVMAHVIIELHRAIHHALLAESLPSFQIPLLSCLALLINASPYNRLRASMVSEMIGDLKQIILSKFEQVRVAAFTCLGGLARYPLRHLGIISGFGLNSDHWLESLCAGRFSCVEPEANSVKLEILQLLNALVNNHFSSSVEVFAEIYMPIIITSLADSFGPLKIHGMKLVAALATQTAASISAQNQFAVALGKSLWLETLFRERIIQSIFFPENESGTEITLHTMRERQILRRETFAALAEMGPSIWAELSSNNQKFCICTLLTHARATTDDVALAAIRTLGIICTYRCTASDVIFLQDVGDLCADVIMKPVNVSLKQKVSWTLSNVCEALWTLNKTNAVLFHLEVSSDFFTKLLSMSLSAYNDKDAVKVNAVRAVGLLLGQARETHISNAPSLYKEAVRLLNETLAAEKEKFFKAKWNACYAMGWILRNPHTRVLLEVNDTLKTLSKHLLECINLKVQIACVNAFDQLSNAHDLPLQYRLHSFQILLEKTSQLTEVRVDYKELKHLQTVKENICLTIFNYLARAEYKLFHELPSMMSKNAVTVEILLKDSMSNLEVKRNLEKLMESSRAPYILNNNEYIHNFLERTPGYLE